MLHAAVQPTASSDVKSETAIPDITSEIPRLRRYARYLTRDVDRADDLVHDCIVRALEKLHTWQPGTNLQAWLLTILRNGFLNECRKNKRHNEAAKTLSLEETHIVPAQQEAALTLSEVEAAFMNLSPDHREILTLVTIEGLSYDQAADILGVSIGTVKSRLFRAREALQIATSSPSA